MLSIGYDIGSSFIKCSILDVESGKTIVHGSSPQTEMVIQSPQSGWAEQDPDLWWENVKILTKKLMKENKISADQVHSIGISYQMHGLVCVDRLGKPLRPSIIWCDSRAVQIGNKAEERLGKEYTHKHLLNSPGNFTASKLRWVKENEPDKFNRIHKILLPGDYIALKLTGEAVTTVSGLTEGIFWDFTNDRISQELLSVFDFDEKLLPTVCPTFSVQGYLTKSAAEELGLHENVSVSYRAGDQPNNAFSLNVLNPGEIAATAGTSGVVYGVIDTVKADPFSRVNLFAHVNHSSDQLRLGVLLCINGTGSSNSWTRKVFTPDKSYDQMNTLAGSIAVGSEGLRVYPFGNGAERMLQNKTLGAQIIGMDFNRHGIGHVIRAVQESVAFSFRYGIDIMKEMGLNITVIRAGKTNMFLSPVFRETLANVTGASIELYDTDGAQGAARGAALGMKLYHSHQDAFKSLVKLEKIYPTETAIAATRNAYDSWLSHLQEEVNNHI